MATLFTEKDWESADAVFQPTNEESGGHWLLKRKIPERWEMKYDSIRFWAMTTPGRHLGCFLKPLRIGTLWRTPIRKAARPIKVLNLFGYTGLASLVAAAGRCSSDSCGCLQEVRDLGAG